MVTTAEMNQVKNIGTSTISSAQWGYVGNMDQHVNSASGVNFRSLYIVDSITMPIQKSFSTAYGVNMAIGVDDVRKAITRLGSYGAYKIKSYSTRNNKNST